MIEPVKKEKLEMVDIEPTDLCNFANSRFPDKESDQKEKVKMGKKKKPPKGGYGK